MDPKNLPKPGMSIIDKLAIDKFLVEKLGFGGIPAYYNPRIHGPYRPDVYYGPSKFIFSKFWKIFFDFNFNLYLFCPFTEDTPLAKVKLGELPGVKLGDKLGDFLGRLYATLGLSVVFLVIKGNL